MLFISSFTNRIDKKGRVSVPAPFRAVLNAEGAAALFVFASMRHPCIEGCGADYFRKLHAQVEAMDPFSPERDAFAAVVFGQTAQLSMDGEGRVGLPEALIAGAKLSDEAVFVGKGETFEIWEPKAHRAHTESARKLVAQAFYGRKP